MVNLSDAVFAIAMTLLVLTVDVPDVPGGELAAALIADLPQLGAYVLAFVLVASQWYAHRAPRRPTAPQGPPSPPRLVPGVPSP